MIKFILRNEISSYRIWQIPLLAFIMASLLFAFGLFLVNVPVTTVFYYLFLKVFLSPEEFTTSVFHLLPLLLCAFGAAISFRAKIFHFSLVAQFLMGILGSIIGIGLLQYINDRVIGELWVDSLFWQNWGAWLLALIIAISLSVVLGFVIAFLWLIFGLHEFWSALAMIVLMDYLLGHLIKNVISNINPNNIETLQYFLSPTGKIQQIICFFVIPLLVFVFLERRHIFIFQIKLLAQSQKLISFAGFDFRKVILSIFLISGITAGMAGFLMVNNYWQELTDKPYQAIGFMGILVMLCIFLGRMRVLGITLVGLVISVINQGAQLLQSDQIIKSQNSILFFALWFLFLLIGDFFSRYSVTITRESPKESTKDHPKNNLIPNSNENTDKGRDNE